MKSDTFKIALTEWLDKDLAAFELAVCLGLMHSDDFTTKAKHVFWSNHEIGDILYQFLTSLIKVGILEENEDEQLRWNKSFNGTWQR